MSTITYIKFAQAGVELDKKKEVGFFCKPKSESTLHEERVESNYVRKSNICSICFTAKSLTGECNC